MSSPDRDSIMRNGFFAVACAASCGEVGIVAEGWKQCLGVGARKGLVKSWVLCKYAARGRDG